MAHKKQVLDRLVAQIADAELNVCEAAAKVAKLKADQEARTEELRALEAKLVELTGVPSEVASGCTVDFAKLVPARLRSQVPAKVRTTAAPSSSIGSISPPRAALSATRPATSSTQGR